MSELNEVTRKGMEAYELSTGDQITVGVTHEIKIGRETSWVKYEAVTKLRPGEGSDDARTRAMGHVNESVMEFVHQVVERVRNAS